MIAKYYTDIRNNLSKLSLDELTSIKLVQCQEDRDLEAKDLSWSNRDDTQKLFSALEYFNTEYEKTLKLATGYIRDKYLNEYKEEKLNNMSKREKEIFNERFNNFIENDNKKVVDEFNNLKARNMGENFPWESDYVKYKNQAIEMNKIFNEVAEQVKIEKIEKESPSKVYTKGKNKYIYKDNSRAKAMKKSRAKCRRPANVAPEYLSEIYDVSYPKDNRGHKIRNSKPILKKNKEKLDLLIEKLEYQSKIKYTTFSYYLKNGNIKRNVEINEIKRDLEKYKIDLSVGKGIYANQRYHLIVNRSNPKFMHLTDYSLYKELRKLIKRENQSLVIYKDKITGQRVKVKSFKGLKAAKNKIDWYEKVLWVALEPEKRTSNRWNEFMNGYWLQLPSLTTLKQDKDYRNKLVDKIITNNMLVKVVADDKIVQDLIKPEIKDNMTRLERFLKRYNRFSYEACNENLSGTKWFSIMAYKFKDLFYLGDNEFKFKSTIHRLETAFEVGPLSPGIRRAGVKVKNEGTNPVVMHLVEHFLQAMGSSYANCPATKQFLDLCDKHVIKLNSSNQMIYDENGVGNNTTFEAEVNSFEPIRYSNIEKAKRRIEKLKEKEKDIFSSYIIGNFYEKFLVSESLKW